MCVAEFISKMALPVLHLPTINQRARLPPLSPALRGVIKKGKSVLVLLAS